jgi:hypothetical protein
MRWALWLASVVLVFLSGCSGSPESGVNTPTESTAASSSSTTLASTTTTPATTTTAPAAATTTTVADSTTTTVADSTTTSITTTTTLPPPPKLEIVDPHSDAYVVGATYSFQGVTDPGCTIDVGGKYYADVEQDGTWSLTLGLRPGANSTTITATDSHGTTTAVRIRVTRLLAMSEAILGVWEGTAEVPGSWHAIGRVRIEFRSDGTWIGEGENGRVFYYEREPDQQTPRPYQVWGPPLGSPNPELQREYPPPEACGPLPKLCMPAYGPTGRGWLTTTLPDGEESIDSYMVSRLEMIVITDTELHFHSWSDTRRTYGPVVYDLMRVE